MVAADYRLRAKPLSEVDSWVGRDRADTERPFDALGQVLDDMADEVASKPSLGQRRRRTS